MKKDLDIILVINGHCRCRHIGDFMVLSFDVVDCNIA